MNEFPHHFKYDMGTYVPAFHSYGDALVCDGFRYLDVVGFDGSKELLVFRIGFYH